MTAFILTLIAIGYIVIPLYIQTVIPGMDLVLQYALFPYMIISLLMFLMFWIILTLDSPKKDFIQGFICEMILAGTLTFFMLTFHLFDNTPIVLYEKYSAMHGAFSLFAISTFIIVAGMLAISLFLVFVVLILKGVEKII